MNYRQFKIREDEKAIINIDSIEVARKKGDVLTVFFGANVVWELTGKDAEIAYQAILEAVGETNEND